MACSYALPGRRVPLPGQKRLLVYGMNIINLPAILFLDEPTSGLDSTSSMALINSLRAYCATGRSAALTIHQPRQVPLTHVAR